jgi:hypothetical protein
MAAGEGTGESADTISPSTLRSQYTGSAGSGRVLPNLDADHALGADISERATSSEAVTEPETKPGSKTSSVEHGAPNLVTKHPLIRVIRVMVVQEVHSTQR